MASYLTIFLNVGIMFRFSGLFLSAERFPPKNAPLIPKLGKGFDKCRAGWRMLCASSYRRSCVEGKSRIEKAFGGISRTLENRGFCMLILDDEAWLSTARSGAFDLCLFFPIFSPKKLGYQ